MYKKGGNDFADFEFINSRDYTIAFATGEEEFNKIIKYLKDRMLIEVGTPIRYSGNKMIYKNVVMKDLGIKEVQKELPKIPMIGLINQEISTGNIEIDKTINHAKQLFFEEPQTSDKMRSACESLSFILEPLRKQCEIYFSKSDTNDFFKIVNDFDIRHNKYRTKQIEFPEQLEWVFYSLLNTINTYTKLTVRDK